MKNLLVTITIFAILVVCGVHFGNVALHKAALKVSQYIIRTSKYQGGQVRDLDFKKVHLTSPRTITVRGVSTIVRPRLGPVSKLDYKGVVQAMHISLADFSFSRVRISMEKSALELLGSNTQASAKILPAIIICNSLTADVPITSWKDPKETIRVISQELVTFLKEGKTSIPFFFDGHIGFSVNRKQYQVKLESEKHGEETQLVLDSENLELVLKSISSDFTKDEIQVVAAYPFRAPLLIELKDEARKIAADAYTLDSNVPEDAYRHIVWSYKLTKAFDAEFAKQVTDAHEAGKFRNEKAEKEKDLFNNSLGIAYALKGVQESELLSKVMNDPEVKR